MAERIFINPPDIIEVSDRIIFLAGPIQGAPDWQTEAARIIHEMDDKIVVASPRKDYRPGEFVYEKQVDWETYFLRKAGKSGVVAFWLPKQAHETQGRSYAQTTRFELGEWKMMHQYENAKIAIGIEEGFGNERYLRRRISQDAPDIKIADSLKAMCENAVDLIRSQ